MKESIRKQIVQFCLKHCKNNICNYLLFKFINEKELFKLINGLKFIQSHRNIKDNFYE